MFKFFVGIPSQPTDVLQHIILPECGIKGADSLYIREEVQQNGQHSHTTTTYINIFHWKQWQTLTGMQHAALEITCMGRGRLVLLGSMLAEPGRTEIFQELAQVDVDVSYAETFVIQLNPCHDFYALRWETDPGTQFVILNAAYTTHEHDVPRVEPDCGVRLALVVTTYRRIEDVTYTVESYLAMCAASKLLAAATHMYVINNDVAAQSSFPFASGKNLTLIHNPCNFGGSGGFARGAYEAVAQGGFSHVVFMDDDAIMHQETLFRTLSLLSRLKSAYRDQVLTGTMFTRENPSWCHVIQEGLNWKGMHIAILGNRDLSSEKETVETLEAIQKNIPLQEDRCDSGGGNQPPLRVSADTSIKPYAAWWYCAIPAHIFVEYGYPRPVFFRGDDQEFGMRIKRYPLPFNGICVWHAAFPNKQNLLRLYLGVRNNALTNILHFRHWRRSILLQLLMKSARALTLRNYAECSVRLLAVQDFLRLGAVPPEGERLIPRVLSVAERYLTGLAPAPAPIPRRSHRRPILWSVITYATLGGILLPKRWQKNLAACWAESGLVEALPQLQTRYALRLSFKGIGLMLRLACMRRMSFIEKLPYYSFGNNSIEVLRKH